MRQRTDQDFSARSRNAPEHPSLHDATIVSTTDGVISNWDAGAERIFGLSAGDAVGRKRDEVLRPIFKDAIAQVEEDLATDGLWVGDVVYESVGGAPLQVRSTMRLVQEGDRSLLVEGLLVLSARHQAQAERRRNEIGYLEEAQRLAKTGVFSWNMVSGEIYWSEETYRMCGIVPGTPLSIPLIAENVHPEDLPQFRIAVRSMMADCSGIDSQHRMIHPNGSIRHIHMIGHFLAQQPNQFVGAVIDATERVTALAELERLRAQFAHASRVATLGELAASIAHEVDQPLAAIATNAAAARRFLGHPEPDLERLRSLNERIGLNARRASDIVSRVRRMARRGETDLETLEFEAVIREAIAFVSHDLSNHQVALHLEMPEAPSLVVGDRVQIQQVIVNLLMNASQALGGVQDAPKAITVGCWADDGMLTVAVSDNGPGIAQDDLDRLFDGFFTTKKAGLGIGLSICRTIVEAHGGAIIARNQPAGGACFEFTLPVSAVD
ncbi:hypothetical protein A6768_08205 [Sphingobium yanoikuyae]|uniref:histidine kinase n=2 Tax=Sphingobium yanoikuyae TaxID=13690 RepID=A0A291MYK9_SPHYA|nr:hypothetical protein A6768_08205 [Sphingobium yanoikuyae]